VKKINILSLLYDRKNDIYGLKVNKILNKVEKRNDI